MLIHMAGPRLVWGYIPSFLFTGDKTAKARDLFDRHYISGWQPFDGFKLTVDRSLPFLDGAFKFKYPGDPVMRVIAVGKFNDELILMLESEWVAIIQPDNSFEVCRMD